MRALTILLVSVFAMAMHTAIADSSLVEVRGTVTSLADNEPLPSATVIISGDAQRALATDANGRFSVRLPRGAKCQIAVSYVGYATHTSSITVSNSTSLNIVMTATAELGEVVVTATEGTGNSTSSIIGRDAMMHLQPNSIADLMELLPGGYAQDPNMGEANTITLRETGTMGAYGTSTRNNNYSISSLGTQFIVDGVPISTDANLQYTPLSDTQSTTSTSSTENSRNITNKGVDMRSISTDDIESVEVVRGIPSVEYGNLTSGLVNIKKIRRAMPLTARFKADGYSKLFSIGKGLALNEQGNSILNVDLGYLDSKIDPTDNFENYKRITGSLRYTLRSNSDLSHSWQLSSAFDYTGSFDDCKEDPDINYGNIEEYKSSYSRLALTNNFVISWPDRLLREFEVNTSLSLQLDRIHQRSTVSPQRYGIVPTTYDEGEQEAKAVYSEYVADYVCDGKPFTAYIKAKGTLAFPLWSTDNTIKFGLNWDISKNFGDGQVYDMNYPLSLSGWSSRPRKYSDIPSLQNLSLFAEELMKAYIGNTRLDIMAGVRLNTMPGLSGDYDMSGHFYADPRLNLGWHMPAFDVDGSPMRITLNGGYGITTKMPTLNYLYPDKYYSNFTSLAYYDTTNPTEDSKFIVTTYIQDPTNYSIKPARNHKWEVRLDVDWDDNSLSVDYFSERMNDGFRYSSTYDVYTYNYYDSSNMAAGVDYTTLDYETKTVLDGYQQVTNGSRLKKSGIELQFTSKRIPCLRTRLNITGAWFHTEYTNSQPMLETVTAVINNVTIKDKYVGLYDWSDGRVNDRVNTNFTFDTQIPEWKLIFTTSFQCIWLVRTKVKWKNGTPVAYLSAEDGLLHEFTDESADDIYLQQLIKTYSDDQFKPFTVPMSMTVNLKVTKEIGQYMRLAFFANKILDYLPDYEANGRVVRRNASPYFGVEASFNI